MWSGFFGYYENEVVQALLDLIHNIAPLAIRSYSAESYVIEDTLIKSWMVT